MALELKRSIPAFFSRKDGCSLSGWRVPMGELELVASIEGKHRKEIHISYKDGCVMEVRQ